MEISLILWALAGLLFSLSNAFTKTIPPTAVVGDITANFKSGCTLDAPQLSAVNASSWEWWYFDAVSPDAKSNVVINFFTASSTGFPFLPGPDVTLFDIHGVLPNGTMFNVLIPADEAVITTTGEGSSGDFKGTNASWTGTPDLSFYKIIVNSPANGVVGTFSLKSLATGHYPCGPVGEGVNMETAPQIGWSNAVPDGVADVDLLLGGTKVAWKGVGYHDKNWSDQPFLQNVASWYWGHGRLGDYSIVWFDTIGMDKKEYVSAYVSKNHHIIVSSCKAGSIKVRPTGANNTYPPTLTSGNPSGFNITIDLGHKGTMDVQVTVGIVSFVIGESYTEWVGTITGSVNGGPKLNGVASLEMFKLTA